MTIRPARDADWDRMRAIFYAVVATGTSYVFASDTSDDDARAYWLGPGISTWVAEDKDEGHGDGEGEADRDDERRILGMYKLIPNRRDRGSHIGNASFMVDPNSQGRRVGETLGRHCLREAKRAGFLAIQYNFVVSTNTAAVRLWRKLGFDIVGTLPRAFRHEELGLVDAYVMYRLLDDVEADQAVG
jgi:ribosomal protein S18 acetylase RimI-like enzyme